MLKITSEKSLIEDLISISKNNTINKVVNNNSEVDWEKS